MPKKLKCWINWRVLLSLIGVIFGFISLLLLCLTPAFAQYFKVPGCPDKYKSKIGYSKLSDSEKASADKTCNKKFFNTELCDYADEFSVEVQSKLKRDANEGINTNKCPPLWCYITGVVVFGVSWLYTIPLLLVLFGKLHYKNIGGHYGLLAFTFLAASGITFCFGFAFIASIADFPCKFLDQLKQTKNDTIVEHFEHDEPYAGAKFPDYKDSCSKTKDWVYRISLLWSGNALAVVAVGFLLTGGCLRQREVTKNSRVGPSESVTRQVAVKESSSEADQQQQRRKSRRGEEDLRRLDELLEREEQIRRENESRQSKN